jgi:hypothetical protein
VLKTSFRKPICGDGGLFTIIFTASFWDWLERILLTVGTG